MRYPLFLVLILTGLLQCFAQSNGLGAFKGHLDNPAGFVCSIVLNVEANGDIKCSLWAGNQIIAQRVVEPDSTHIVTWNLNDGLRFRARYVDGAFAYGFMQSGIMQQHIPLSQKGDLWTGEWLPWYVHSLIPATIYLGVEGDDGGDRQFYPFFDDPRFPGTNAGFFQKVSPNVWSFKDFFTGIQFQAKWEDDHYDLEVRLGKALLSSAHLTAYAGNFPNPKRPAKASFNYRKPTGNNVWGVQTAMSAGLDRDRLATMTQQVDTGAYLNTDAILIARSGKLVYEEYFGGFNRSTVHQLRSAQKSLTGTLSGLAIQDGYFPNVDANLRDYLQEDRQPFLSDDSRKTQITLKHLLTMRSGLDAIDFGVERLSLAAENNYQPTPDWTATILQAPMIHDPGEKAWYGTANPHLVGDMLRNAVPEPLPFYQHEQLLATLGISSYAIQNNLQGQMYTGGGMYLRPIDMLTYGQLYLQKGKWDSKTLLPKSFIDSTFHAYAPLENAVDKNGYGYLWWQHSYSTGVKQISTWEARGAGGQYIMVIPELDMVVVITSSNYRNGGFNLPESILQDHILPAVSR